MLDYNNVVSLDSCHTITASVIMTKSNPIVNSIGFCCIYYIAMLKRTAIVLMPFSQLGV